MRKLALSIGLLIFTLPAMAGHQLLICADCRDVREHPSDFGNYAFNSLIAPLSDDFSIFTTYSTSTYVWNRQDQWALVLLEDVIADTGASVSFAGITIPVQISSEFTKITVQDQYGKMIVYEVLETSNPLSVGDGTVSAPSTPAPPPPPPEASALPSGGPGGYSTPCCQDGAFYWYYGMPEFQIQTFNE